MAIMVYSHSRESEAGDLYIQTVSPCPIRPITKFEPFSSALIDDVVLHKKFLGESHARDDGRSSGNTWELVVIAGISNNHVLCTRGVGIFTLRIRCRGRPALASPIASD